MRSLIGLAACAALAAGPALAVVIPAPPKAPAKGSAPAKKAPAPKEAAPAVTPPPPVNPLLVRQRGVSPRAAEDAVGGAHLEAGQRWTVVAVGANNACSGSLSIERANPDAAIGLLRIACRERSTTTSFTQAATLVETGDSVVVQLRAAEGAGAAAPAWRAVRLRKDSPMRMTGAVGQGPDAYVFTLMLDGG